MRALLAVWLIAATTAAGAAAQPAQRGIEVRPSITEPARPVADEFTSDITYVNHDAEPRQLSLGVYELRHDLEGSPVAARDAEIREAFRLNTSELQLPPKGTATVRLSGRIPQSTRSAYVDVVATRVAAPGSNVEVRSMLHSQFLLRGARPWQERIAITDVGLADPDQLYVDVRATGNVHVAPRGEIEVKQGGRTLTRVRVGATTDAAGNVKGRILPSCPGGGCVRRYVARWRTPADLRGPLTLTATLRGPDATLTKTVGVGEGSRTPGAQLTFTSVEPSAITAVVENTSALALDRPSVQFQALDAANHGRALDVFRQRTLPPGASAEVRWTPTLPDGRYTIVGRVLLGTDTLAEATTTLQVGDIQTEEQRDQSPGLIIVALVLLGLAVTTVFWLRRRFAG